MSSAIRPIRRRAGRRAIRGRRALALAGAAVVAAVPAVVIAGPPAAPPAAAATPARGIDVSSYQHPGGAAIDWRQVRGSGVEFAFIKATEGPVGCSGGPYTNGWLRRDWADAGAAGVHRGAYHFARPGDVGSALAQARNLAAAVGPMNGALDLPPVLDLEVTCGLPAPALVAFARAWVDEVIRLTGRTPIIYTGYYFWRDSMGGDTGFATLPLWIATYGSRPLVPRPWPTWTFWQHSSTGSVPGIGGAVDLDWFAAGRDGLARMASATAGHPVGALDVAAGGRGSIRAGGWALDPDSPAPLYVHVWVDDRVRAVPAGGNRPDVGAAYPAAGPAHGYDVVVPDVPSGRHDVCVWAINIGPGRNTLIGCAPVNVTSAQPFGALDVVTGGFGSVRVAGWTADPDAPVAVPAGIWIDGVPRLDVTADRPRADVGAAVAGAGPDHGFDITIPDVPGGAVHTVCVWALNVVGFGTHQLLGCRAVFVPGGPPLGAMDAGPVGPGSLRVTGWALDPDTTASTPVHIYVDGAVHGVDTDVSLPNLAAFFIGYGPEHGYDATFDGLGPGSHTVCVYAINVAGPEGHSFLGCRAVTVI